MGVGTNMTAYSTFQGSIRCHVCGSVHINPETRMSPGNGLPQIVIVCPKNQKTFPLPIGALKPRPIR